MADENTVKEQLDALIKGVNELQTKHTSFEEKATTSTATTTQELEAIKTNVTSLVEQMQEEKQKSAALIQRQKEDFELLQKDLANASGASGDELKKAFADYDDHIAAYMRKGLPIPQDDIEKICTEIAKKAAFGVDDDRIEREAKTLVAGSNVDGGFFVTPDRAGKMSERRFETSAMRAVCNIETTTSDSFEVLLDDDEAAGAWVTELGTRSNTDTAQLGKVTIPIHEVMAYPKLSQKIIDDAGLDIVGWHQKKATNIISRKENTAFVTGANTDRPKGFLTYSAWTTAGTYQRNAVEQISTATASTIAGNDLLKVAGSLPEPYQINAEWATSRATFYDYVLTLKNGSGDYLMNQRMLQEGGKMMLLGHPVNLFADMPAKADSALCIALADWREFYTIVDRMGIRVLRNPFKTSGVVYFETTARVGGDVTNYEAGKILKVTAA